MQDLIQTAVTWMLSTQGLTAGVWLIAIALVVGVVTEWMWMAYFGVRATINAHRRGMRRVQMVNAKNVKIAPHVTSGDNFRDLP